MIDFLLDIIGLKWLGIYIVWIEVFCVCIYLWRNAKDVDGYKDIEKENLDNDTSSSPEKKKRSLRDRVEERRARRKAISSRHSRRNMNNVGSKEDV